MKIIDYDLKGNVVRFYLGKTTVHDYHGDDWNDILNESGCYPVYREYVSGTADIAFPFDALVLDPCSSEFSYHRKKCVSIFFLNVGWEFLAFYASFPRFSFLLRP